MKETTPKTDADFVESVKPIIGFYAYETIGFGPHILDSLPDTAEPGMLTRKDFIEGCQLVKNAKGVE